MDVSKSLEVDEVKYTITGHDLDRTGTLDAGNRSSFTGVIGDIPAGEGYKLKLSATAEPNRLSCSGSATFDVSAGQKSTVNIVMQCGDEAPRGTVTVNGRTDVCPVVDALSAAPAAVAAGDTVALRAKASDEDDSTLTYHWKADSGSFEDANSEDTTYTCDASGAQVLTFSVRDEAGCADSASVEVTCGEAAQDDAGPRRDAGASPDGGAPATDGGASPDAGGNVPPSAGDDAGAAPESDAGSAVDGGGGGGGGAGGTGVVVTGTWISRIQTAGAIEAPVVGSVNADINLVVRILVTEAAGSYTNRIEICSLQTTSTPNASALAVTYPESVISTLNDTQSEPTFTAGVGDPFMVPSFTILSGIDASGAATDADGDGNPGVTLPTNIGGLLALDAYVGLKLDTSITANVTAADQLSGTTAFSVTGTVFGSNNPVLSTGSINVTPASTAVPLTSRRLDGDVPCSEVGSML